MPHTPASFPAVTALVGIPNGRAPGLVTPTAALPMISHSGTALTGEREAEGGVLSGGRCEGGLLHGRHGLQAQKHMRGLG